MEGIHECVSKLRFDVTDTGIGIAATKRDRLFQPFSQVDASLTRRFGGSGLGLAICRKLVERMGGQISVTSEPHQGSTFWFVLPLQLAEGKPQTSAEIAVDVSVRSLRVLLAEDNPANQMVLTALLEKLGHRPLLVANGQEALAAAEKQKFDLILLDVQMPEMDGPEAAS